MRKQATFVRELPCRAEVYNVFRACAKIAMAYPHSQEDPLSIFERLKQRVPSMTVTRADIKRVWWRDRGKYPFWCPDSMRD